MNAEGRAAVVNRLCRLGLHAWRFTDWADGDLDACGDACARHDCRRIWGTEDRLMVEPVVIPPGMMGAFFVPSPTRLVRAAAEGEENERSRMPGVRDQIQPQREGLRMSVVTFEPKDERIERGWPAEIIGDGFIELALTSNEIGLNDGEATYQDGFGEKYVITRLRSGKFVGDIRED